MENLNAYININEISTWGITNREFASKGVASAETASQTIAGCLGFWRLYSRLSTQTIIRGAKTTFPWCYSSYSWPTLSCPRAEAQPWSDPLHSAEVMERVACFYNLSIQWYNLGCIPRGSIMEDYLKTLPGKLTQAAMLPNRIKAEFKARAAFIAHLKLGKGSSLGWGHMKEIKAEEGWLRRTDELARLKPSKWY